MPMTPPDTLEAQAAAELADALGETPKPRARPSRAGKRGTRVRAAQAKPKAPPTRKPTAPRPPARPALDRKVYELLAGTAMTLAVIGQTTERKALLADGQALAEHADNVATALVKVADEHPGFRRVLEVLTTTSVYGELVMALAPLGIAIARNHNLLPAPQAPPMPNVVDGVPAAA